MSAGLILLIIVLVVIAAIVIAGISIYNGIVTQRNRVDNAWSNIEANLQRRNDLIPNLVETVKGYTTHETEVFEQVTEARAAATAARTPSEVSASANQVTEALRQLFAVAENYPDLKANQNFLQLQSQLDDTENRIVYARQSYNDCVLNYNTAIQTFPGNLLAGIGHFEPRDGFEVTADEAREVPNVTF